MISSRRRLLWREGSVAGLAVALGHTLVLTAHYVSIPSRFRPTLRVKMRPSMLLYGAYSRSTIVRSGSAVPTLVDTNLPLAGTNNSDRAAHVLVLVGVVAPDSNAISGSTARTLAPDAPYSYSIKGRGSGMETICSMPCWSVLVASGSLAPSFWEEPFSDSR